MYVTEAAECCETWGGIMFHSAIRIPLLKFSKMPFALIVGTSNLVDPSAPTPPPVLQLVKSLPFRAQPPGPGNVVIGSASPRGFKPLTVQ